MDYEKEWLENLQRVSPSVKTVLETESYLQTIEGVDPVNVFTICTEAAELDLRNLGFFIHMDLMPESSTEMARVIYTVLNIFSQEFFNTLLRKLPSTLDGIKDFVENTKREEAEEEVFDRIVGYLNNKFPNNPDINDLLSMLEDLEYHYNSTFITHIVDILEDVPYDDIYGVEDSLPLIAEFMKVMVANREAYAKCIDKVLTKYPTLDKEYLLTAVKLYDIEKIQPANVGTFSWIIVTPEKDLTPTQVEYKNKIVKQHERNNTHHIEYYHTRDKIDVRLENVVELVSHHIEPEDTSDEMLFNIVEMVRSDVKLANNKETAHKSIFTPEYISFIKELAVLFLAESLTEKKVTDAFNTFTK